MSEASQSNFNTDQDTGNDITSQQWFITWLEELQSKRGCAQSVSIDLLKPQPILTLPMSVQKHLTKLIANACYTISPYFDDWNETNPQLQFEMLMEVLNATKAGGRKNWKMDEVKLMWCPPGYDNIEDTIGGAFIAKVITHSHI
jgi:hypothetical protein